MRTAANFIEEKKRQVIEDSLRRRSQLQLELNVLPSLPKQSTKSELQRAGRSPPRRRSLSPLKGPHDGLDHLREAQEGEMSLERKIEELNAKAELELQEALQAASEEWAAERHELQSRMQMLAAASTPEMRNVQSTSAKRDDEDPVTAPLRAEIATLTSDARALRSAKARLQAESEKLRTQIKNTWEQIDAERNKMSEELAERTQAKLEKQRECHRLREKLKDSKLQAEREQASRKHLQQHIQGMWTTQEKHKKLRGLWEEKHSVFMQDA